MKRFLRMLLGLALLPAACGCAMALADTVRAVPVPEDSIFPPGVLALLLGIAAFVAVWTLCPRPVRVYVLGHELTHAVWGLLFGARVSDLRVREDGGSVKLTKSNVVITLAPYFFPFYTIAVVAAAAAVRLLMGRLPCPWAWMFAVGFTWCLHCCFTIQSLMQRQPDILVYGRFFSWSVILIVNIVGIIVWIAVTAPLPLLDTGAAVARRTGGAYRAVLSAAARCTEMAVDAFRGGGS